MIVASGERKKNAQTMRTKKWIRETLIQLMEEKPFNQISISELAQRADLSRFSFYSHYSSKEDVVREILECIMKENDEKYNQSKTLSVSDGWNIVFQNYIRNRKFLIQLGQNNLLHIWEEVCNKHYVPVTERFILNGTIRDDTNYYRYFTIYHGSAFVNTVYAFLLQKPEMSAQEMTDTMLKLRGNAYYDVIKHD